MSDFLDKIKAAIEEIVTTAPEGSTATEVASLVHTEVSAQVTQVIGGLTQDVADLKVAVEELVA
ncbi:MAG: hypothetical protein WCL30_04090, partial [Pseudomonadota bacterium]